ncbi:alpha/beta fold hydrolase [Epidermidibacterium keratini]|uniref:Alpha/beta fold hydrolase n=1 Tax=Epidermidibacterium keratini TaxID=1891644 RepID=A0A7L4YRZ1_9ACTN|nr:alpha/beta fold hydrolase [Epidermidibacterium keratini]QHC01926.1 alpha/beta fold hydrolase [Epidermidibacterium keratini]
MGTTSTVTLGDGTRTRYRLDGPDDAPVLMLSNSIATTLDMWDRNITDFAGHFRVLRYDTRGHGESDAPGGAYSIERLGRDVVELMDALDIDTAHFCGLSLGGFIGQWLGIHEPDRIDKLVLANTSAYLGPAPQWDAKIIDVLNAPDLTEIAAGFLCNWFPDQLRADEALVGPFRDDILGMRVTGLAGCLAAVRDADLRRTLPLIRAETLVIIGEHDTVCLPEHGTLIADSIPAAERVRMPVTHLSNVEDPTGFANAVFDFLGER